MKRFRVQGWFRYNDEKDFFSLTINSDNGFLAVTDFLNEYQGNLYFYKITVEEIL